MKDLFKYQGPALTWALFILIICSVPFGEVGKSTLFFPGFDKVTHCGLFFVLAVLISRGLLRKGGRGLFSFATAAGALFTTLIYGGLIEVLQRYFFTWRSGEWDDLFCDTVGACMGVFAILLTLNAANDAKG